MLLSWQSTVRLSTSNMYRNNSRKKFYSLNLVFFLTWTITSAHILDWFVDKFSNSVPQLNSTADKEILKEAMLDPVEISEKHGYAAEYHNVTTRDGYILTLHRIPRGKKAGNGENVIFLMHGNLATSHCWLEVGERSLAFFLADNGFDVWMGNFRGNYFTSHQKYSRRHKKFWDFSWEQMVHYDIPDMIDYILTITAKSKLIYSGHSMGTTAGFAFLSTYKNYHNKIAGFIPLSPATALTYSPALFRISPKHAIIQSEIVKLLGIHHAPSLQPNQFKLEQYLCPASDPSFCGLIIDLIQGYDPYLRNNSKDFIYFNHLSIGGASRGILEHYTQIYYKRGMYRYDYGWLLNLLHYNSFKPPAYDFKQIKPPVAILYGANDCWANPVNICLLKKKLPNVIGFKLIDYPMFSHVDFFFAMNGDQLFFNDFLNFAKKMIS